MHSPSPWRSRSGVGADTGVCPYIPERYRVGEGISSQLCLFPLRVPVAWLGRALVRTDWGVMLDRDKAIKGWT
jgi:hypothetical protein